MKKNDFFLALVLTIAALMVGQSVWAQATQEVGVLFGWEPNKENSNYYRYSITPSKIGGKPFESNFQLRDYVQFDNTEFDIGDNNIPLTMKLKGNVNFTNAGNFTVDNDGSLFYITFTSTTKYIMGASVTTNSGATVSGCTITGAGTKQVTIQIPDKTVFGGVTLTIANHTPFGKDNSATISGIDAEYLDDGVNEPVPTVTYREFSSSTPVTLTAGTDYTVSYINNHYLGTATLNVIGTGNYCGSVSKDFTIRSYDLRDFNKLGEGIYEIATKDDLDHLAIYVNRDNPCPGVTFRQTADIAYTYQYEWDNINNTSIDTENNYTAIGGFGKPFKGTYDGQGHSISGIRIKKVYNKDKVDEKNNASSQGFIGYLGSGGTVKNVLVKDALIDAYTNIGGIVGYNSGSIIDCTAYHVRVFAQIDGDVDNGRGPITGFSDGTITRSHNRDCAVPYNIKGKYLNNRYTDDLFALTLGTNVTASQTSGESVTIDGVAYYTQGSTFAIGYSGEVPAGSTVVYTVSATSNGGDVTGYVLSGTTLTIPGYDVTVSDGAYKNDYITHWQASPQHDGSSSDKAYLISTPAGLQLLASEAKSNNGFSGTWFKLNNNIDMSGVTDFEPVVFKGHLYSSGANTISHLTINSTSTQVGLFGVIDGGSVWKLTLSEASISGQDYVGGIAGQILSGGIIQQCHVVGSTITVKESNLPCAGTIVGFNNGGTLSNNLYHSTLVYAPNIQGTYYKAGGTAFNIGVGYDKNNANPYGDVAGGAEFDDSQLYLYDDRNNSDLIAAYNDPASHIASGGTAPSFTSGIDVSLLGRTLYEDGYWNTLCLPFSMTAEQIAYGLLAKATLMELDTEGTYDGHQTGFDATNGILYLYFKAAGSITAGKPYIVKWTTTDDPIQNPMFLYVKISSATPTEVTFTGGKFAGTYSPVPFTANDKSILFLGGSNKLYYPDGTATTTTIGAFRAYFSLTPGEGSSVKEIVLNFEDDDSADGIIAIDNGQLTIDNEDSSLFTLHSSLSAWYTLDGRKLGGKPTQRGIYVNDGRKTVIK